MLSFDSGLIWRLIFLALAAKFSAVAGPVEFSFSVPEREGSPFAREVWAVVQKPSGITVRAPAFHLEADRFCVRIRAGENEWYRLMGVEESELDDSSLTHPLEGVLPASASFEVTAPVALSSIGIAAWDPRSFSLEDGSPYVPMGGNVPWRASGREAVGFYRERFQEFENAGLNWMRVWMAHFGDMNLDWLNDPEDGHPQPGWLDVRVAERWDAVIEMAEAAGVYVQVVLQYHGQYSSEINSNWDLNPWNSALPGGFLEKPADFFTSEQARRLTRQKYRYIAARWGYSPAVMAWELFNEVHWVDALRFDLNETAVAAWHAEMADTLRSVDVHGHLVTTSMDSIESPIYDRMDYLQPHIYPIRLLPSLRYIEPVYEMLGKPVFYGEYGDDYVELNEEANRSGSWIVPPVWSGIMGQLHLPPQPWFIDELIDGGRLGELAAVGRFLTATGLAENGDLVPFSPIVHCAERMPLRVEPAYVWIRRGDPVAVLSTDGRATIGEALVPGILVGDAFGLGVGFSGQVSLEMDLPQPARMVVHLRPNHEGAEGSAGEISMDGATVFGFNWPPSAEGSQPQEALDLSFEAPAGPRKITVRNAGGPDWFHFDGMDTGLDQPLIGAVGRRGDRFIALWVWNRKGVFEPNPADTAIGTILVEEVPAGEWRVVWWNTQDGTPLTDRLVEHDGGTLSLETPPVGRHAAVVLTR